MNTTTLQRPSPSSKLPLWLKIAFTSFMVVLIPTYWVNYGPTNFLYFCDIALLLTLAGVWKESALLISMPTVGIVIPQLLWCADFGATLFGGHLTGMTDYMFDDQKSLFLRGLSLFHGWLPLLLLWLVARVGYDKRAFAAWTALALVLCSIAYFFLPPAGAALSNPNLPRNVNYVFGFDDTQPQKWMSAPAYFVTWIGMLLSLVYVPTHLALKKLCRAA